MSKSNIFSARDYQHKRFRSRGGDTDREGISHPQTAAATPRLVTPPRSPVVLGFPDNIPRKITLDSTGDNNSTSAHMSSIGSAGEQFDLPNMLHKTSIASTSPLKEHYVHEPTASNGGLTSASTLKPTESLRYSLNGSKEMKTHESKISSEGMSQKLRNAHAMALQQRSSSDSRLASSTLRHGDLNSYKIFLLLLQPKSKIFELIQLLYNPNDTTVGRILDMIPDNATEAALGSQKYIGLCRPKTQEELLDHELLASEVRPGVPSAKISLGEILVAIPDGFTGAQVATLSKQILANPKIVKLLKRADPLAPKRKKHRHRSHRSSRRSSSREAVHVLEKHEEEEQEGQVPVNSEHKMKKAMEHAAAEAAAANAAITGSIKFRRSNSIMSQRSLDLSMDGSLDDSYTSWSKSFDASFSAQSSICSGVSKRAIRRRERQARRLKILHKSLLGAFVTMVLFYWLDPNHGSAMYEEHKRIQEQPMGVTGVFQSLFLLLTLYKAERLLRRSNSSYENRSCPFLKAASGAMKRFKSKYSKKLHKKSLVNGRIYDLEGDDVSHRLRKFNLKRRDDDTGSI